MASLVWILEQWIGCEGRIPELRQGRLGRSPRARGWRGGSAGLGVKVRVATSQQGRAHGVAVTDASVHDPQMMDKLLQAEEEEVYGDKAYASGERKARLESKGGTCRIHRKARRGKKLTCADRAFNRKSSRTWSKVEHIFGVVKHLWGYRKVRCRGIEKNASQVFTLMALANLYLCRKDLAA